MTFSYTSLQCILVSPSKAESRENKNNLKNPPNNEESLDVLCLTGQTQRWHIFLGDKEE
jgi:hypothetical protein